ncbi:HNH endonuclease [Geomonas subterranea]|uniref:HNH endonuclease n=1 Tax=Geomonas subterranea TaxID=2847989 RepID=A0ABX8LPA1_9BACT|nr:HNH endonuclease [Geomonas subterranea]QXE92791.1 HNH endonuclease [Geomonas subterranea]QXM09106.1 HNH endonuclease [Geomonas subterranea]
MDTRRDHVITGLVETGKWCVENARLSERAGHKCEYCGLDFLASPENYKQWQRDHIVPESKGGDSSFENLAVACKTCNVDFKNRWNPRDIAGEVATRSELIDAVKVYISQRKEKTQQEIETMKSIINCDQKAGNGAKGER